MATAHALHSPDPSLVLAKAVLNAARRLGLGSRQLGHVLGCSEATVSRLRSGKGLDPASKEGQLAALIIRAYRSLNAIVGGNDEQSEAWFHAQHHELGGVPADRIATVEGLVDVVQYLDAMRARI
ncbi:MAG: MbcA/ParS/Xre antitoxin family protein [Wenzhouxiangellaceae bacterium]